MKSMKLAWVGVGALLGVLLAVGVIHAQQRTPNPSARLTFRYAEVKLRQPDTVNQLTKYHFIRDDQSGACWLQVVYFVAEAGGAGDSSIALSPAPAEACDPPRE